MFISRLKIWLLVLTVYGGGCLGLVLSAKPPPTLGMIFCDVGQGDAILLQAGHRQILIDGGPSGQVLSCLKAHLPAFDRELELVVSTHPDADHLTGLIAVLQTYRIKTLLIDNLPKAGSNYQRFYNLVWEQKEKFGLQVVAPQRAQNWCLSSALCCQVISDHPNFLPEKIWAQKIPYQKLLGLITKNIQKSFNYNDSSIALNCTIAEKKLTLLGDIGAGVELALTTSGLLTKVDVLKIAHHGSKTSSNLSFLEILKPEESLILCGANNPYSHPHQQTLDRLSLIGSRVWRTDHHGTVSFLRDRDGVWSVVSSR